MRNIKFEKPDRDTVIKAWIGLLMFIGVPFVLTILWRQVIQWYLSAYS